MKQNTPQVCKILGQIQEYYQKQKDKLNQGERKVQYIKKQNLTQSEAVYKLENLQKNLNEITAKSTSGLPDKKNEQKKEIIKKTYNPSKFFKTGQCRNGINCIYAHSKQELDSQYLPDAWISHFQGNKTKNNSSIARVQSASVGLTKTFYQSNQEQNKVYGTSDICSINKIIDKKGRSILIQSVLMNNAQAVKNILSLGGDPTFMDWSGFDSIMYAIKKNYYDIMCLLIDLSSVPIDFNRHFFTSKTTYLTMAAKLAQSNMVISLLTASAEPNVHDYLHRTPIFYSIELNDFDSIYALVDHGANLTVIDDFNKSPVDYAYEKKNLQMISYLFRKGGSLADNTKHKKILFFAAENNMVELIQEMIKRGIQQQEKDKDGNNLLMLAFINQHYDTVYELIETFQLRAQINIPNKNGDTLLILALKNGVQDMCKQLIQLSDKNQLDYQDKEKKTALMYAAEYGYHDILEQLLDKQVEPNKTDKHGKTALMMACKNGHLLCVESILEMKPDTQLKHQKNQKEQDEFNIEENQNNKKQSQIQVGIRDSYGLSARNYSQNPEIISLINQFMIDTCQLSESFSKELEQEKFKLDAYFQNPKKESQLIKKGQKKSQLIVQKKS